jgi:serine/threonine protein kinase
MKQTNPKSSVNPVGLSGESGTMKSRHFGLIDSLGAVAVSPNECPNCHTASRIGRGLCLGCLLQAGLNEEEQAESEEFDEVLAAIEIKDAHWRLGNYEVLEEIGRGGMGVIYRARQRHSRRIVALKRVLSYHADSRETLARFRREAEAAASLDHPNILPIYEVAESEEGVPFFSMKFAPGGSLQQAAPALRDDPRECVRLMAKVTRAVQYAHRAGILHRDLKPGNILLDARGEPLVSDFGLAKWLDATSDLTRTLTIFGTPGYIAPEQAHGLAAEVKPAADVYSLGAILFDLLAGRPPFLGEHALAVIRQAAEKPAPKLRSLLPKLDRDLETICARCLERAPAARYGTASDLAVDLERWLERRPIIARPVSPPMQLWRWAKRNPVLSAASIGVSSLAVIAIVAFVGRSHLASALREESIARRSMAVLPLLDLDAATADGESAQAIAAVLQSKLGPSSLVRMTVLEDGALPVPTLPNLRAAGHRAKTPLVLTGTIRRPPDGLRISLRVADAASGETIFQKTLAAKGAQARPDSLSGLIPAELSAALDGNGTIPSARRDPIFNNEAANEYLRAGHEFENRRDNADLDRALQCFEKAIEAEPTSALARARFTMAAITRLHMAGYSPALRARAGQLAREAIGLNPDLPEAHRALSALAFSDGALAESVDHAVQAIESGGLEEGPVMSIASSLKMLGRPDLSLRWHAIAKQLQEHPSDYEFSTADCWADLCVNDRAESIYRRVSALHPDLPEGWAGACRLRLLAGDLDGARKLCRDNVEKFSQFDLAQQVAAQVEFFGRNWPEAERLYSALAQSDELGGAFSYGAITYQSALGRLRQLQGDQEGGRALLARGLSREREALATAPTHPDILYRTAAIESSLGDTEGALRHLRAAFQGGRLDYRSMELDPRFDALRKEEDYIQIRDDMTHRVTALRQKQLGESNGQEREITK